MANRLADFSTSNSSVRCDQNDWTMKLKNIELDELKTVRSIGKGHNSTVSVVCLDRYPDALFVLKTITAPDDPESLQDQEIEKQMFIEAPDDPETLKDQEIEKQMFIEAQNDFVAKLYRTFTDDKATHLLMEFLPGGELYDLGKVSENDAKFYLGCLVEAIDHLHTRNIVHNDIKTSNLVLDVDGYAKLIDFGFAMQLEGENPYDDASGTAECLPPEVVWRVLNDDFNEEQGRDKAGDLWAMGVLLYDLLTGISPFNPDDTDEEKEIYTNVTKGIESLQFPREDISEEAEDLIRNLCTYKPESRLGYNGIDEIRAHRWFNGFEWSKLRDRKLTPPMVPVVSVEDT